jgi:hypothetical protein
VVDVRDGVQVWYGVGCKGPGRDSCYLCVDMGDRDLSGCDACKARVHHYMCFVNLLLHLAGCHDAVARSCRVSCMSTTWFCVKRRHTGA